MRHFGSPAISISHQDSTLEETEEQILMALFREHKFRLIILILEICFVLLQN